MSRCKSWGGSSVFEWLCCVCSQTRLGPGPRQQGRQVQEEGFPTLGTERSVEWRGRSAAEVCTSEARKIGGCLLSRARDGVPQQAWFPCISVKAEIASFGFRLLRVGVARRERPAEMCGGRRQGQAPTSELLSVPRVTLFSHSF